MHDSVIGFFKDHIQQEIDDAKERLAAGSCQTLEAYQYEVCRIRTLQQAYELFTESIKLSQSTHEED